LDKTASDLYILQIDASACLVQIATTLSVLKATLPAEQAAVLSPELDKLYERIDKLLGGLGQFPNGK